MEVMRILVVKPSSLGDVIQMLQVMEGAYHAAQDQQIHLDIHWIIRDCFAEFLQQSPCLSRLFIFERHGGWRGFKRLMQQVRTCTYDYLIDGQGLLRSGLMTFLAKASCKIGRKDAREGSRWFYHRTYAPPPDKTHAVDILQALLQPLQLVSVPQRPLTLKGKPWSFPFPPGGLLLFPNSRGLHKEWPYFYELTLKLLERTTYPCIWVGQVSPQRVPQHPRFINFIGKTSLDDLTTLIQGARCVVANDSGPIHLAAALRKPLVGLYGPTDGRKYGPFPTDQHCVLQAPQGRLSDLSIDQVLQAIENQLP